MIEKVAARRREQGKPGWDRFGLTVLAEGEQVGWLDRSDGELQWTIPNGSTAHG